MVVAVCPFPTCEYRTADLDPAIAGPQLTIHGKIHESAGAAQSNTKKPERPQIKADMDESEWEEFLHFWTGYKKDAKIETKPDQIRSELQLCCSQEIKSRLFQVERDNLLAINEKDLLAAIKLACVNKTSKTAHRNNFFSMVQSPGESPQSYVARLKSRASLCEFSVPYKCSEACVKDKDMVLPYFTDAVENQLVAGLANPEHRRKLTLEAATYPTLQDKLNLLDQIHTHEREQNSASSEQRSQYRVGKSGAIKKCACGTILESKNEKHTLCKECFTKTKTKTCECGTKIVPTRSCCFKCSKKKNPDKESAKSEQATAHPGETTMFSHTAVFEPDSSLDPDMTVSSDNSWCLDRETESDESSEDLDSEEEWAKKNGINIAELDDQYAENISINANEKKFEGGWARKEGKQAMKKTGPKLAHGRWNGEKFVAAAPLKHPRINAKVRPMKYAMETWKLENGLIRKRSQNWDPLQSISVTSKFYGHFEVPLADTGAMLCSIQKSTVEQMGISEEDYLPTDMMMMGCSGKYVDMEGAIMAQITIGSHITHQIMYVADTPAGSVLSQEALMDLGIIPRNFPAQMPISNNMNTVNANDVSNMVVTSVEKCECPSRKSCPPLPEKIPFEPTEENVEKLEGYIKKYHEESAMNTCTHQDLPAISGGKMTMHFKENAVPDPAYTPAKVPIHFKEATKALLDSDERLGVIERVPQGTPTVWASRMIMQRKKSGALRRTIDLQKVNKSTLRETNYTSSPHNLVCDIPQGQYKAVIDCWNSYHAVELDEVASAATTFVTEWGNYRYRRAPQGFHASGDHYTKRKYAITAEFQKKREIVDDTLLYDDSIESLFWTTMKYIKTCADNGIIINPAKIVFGKKNVEFAGFELTEDGYKPTKNMLQAIANFPVPQNITDVRSFYGLIEQVAYAFSKSESLHPFRELLKKSSTFYWSQELTDLFEKSKKIIVKEVSNGVKTYEIGRPTALTTDFSTVGLGYFLQQKYCDCKLMAPNCGPGHWKLITAGSRFLKDAEKRYAPVEGEALAMVYGLTSTKVYCLGNEKLIVGVDHKPLLAIMGDKPMDQIDNPRLLSFKQKASPYSYTMVHIPGKEHVGPDTTSRYPGSEGNGDTLLEPDDGCLSMQATFCLKNGALLGDTVDAMAKLCDTNESDEEANELENNTAIAIGMSLSTFQTLRWEDLIEACVLDDDTQEIVRSITEGFPERREDASENIKKVWHCRSELYQVKGVPMVNNRMYIPKGLRPEVLSTLHAACQGTIGMKNSARTRFWWPGMDAAITQTRNQCRKCDQRAPSAPGEEMLEEPAATFPFEKIVMDYFEQRGNHYLAQADRYSGWLSVAKVTNTSFTELSRIMREHFVWHGVPESISTDGGPPFNGEEFRQFCKKWHIRHRKSSAGYPESNGRAELAVKSAKRLLEKNTSGDGSLNTDGVVRAMLQYKNTPLRGINESPAEIVFGRPIQDNLPQVPQEGWKRINDGREIGMARVKIDKKETYDLGKRNMEPLENGDVVIIQNMTGPHPKKWMRTGTVIENLGNRQYSVRVDGSRRLILRNRKNLKRIKPIQEKDPQPQQPAGNDYAPDKSLSPKKQQTGESSYPAVPTPKKPSAHPAAPTPKATSPLQRAPPRIVEAEVEEFDRIMRTPTEILGEVSVETPYSTPTRQSQGVRSRRLADQSFSPVQQQPAVSPAKEQPSPAIATESERPKRVRKAPAKFSDYVGVDEVDI